MLLTQAQWSTQIASIRSFHRATRNRAVNLQMAEVRAQACRDSIAELRRFAMLKPGRVQDYCLGLAQAQERELKEVHHVKNH